MSTVFLGTGLIGAAMAEAALARGESVTVWNRTASKTAPLAEHGARVATDLVDAVQGAERVHVALADDAAVDGVLERIVAALPKDALVIDHTTTSPAGTAKRAKAMTERGIAFLHAPIFMSPASCRASRGIILVSGPRDVFGRAEGALSRMTGRVEYLGERPDQAATYKLFGNAAIVALVGVLADVNAIAAEQGLGPSDVSKLYGIFEPSGMLVGRGNTIAAGDYRASFELAMARKDVRLMIEAAGDRPLALLPGLASRMDALIAKGHGADDLAALAIESVPKKG